MKPNGQHFVAFVTVVLLAMAGVFVARAAGAADERVTITGVDVAAAPEVTLTVAVDGAGATELDEDDFQLLVSGEARDVVLTGLPGDPMQVELVIDTSGSMKGAPLAAAKIAAQALVDELPATVEVGVVGFGNAPYLVLAHTSDRAAATAAIAGLQSGGETALYDAASFAAQQLQLDRRAVVLLTDGKDTVSTGTLDSAVSSLASAATSFYSVVLDTPEVDVGAAEALAAAAGGTVVRAADPSALVGVYDEIAGQLNASYQVAFRATATGSTGMRIRVNVDGEVFESEARAVVPVADAAVAPREVAVTNTAADASPEYVNEPAGFAAGWGKWFGALSLFLAFVLIGVVLISRQPRPSQLAAEREIRRAGRGSAVATLTEQAASVAERQLDRSGRRGGLERALEAANINIRSGEFVVLVTAGAFVAFALGLLMSGLILAIVLAAIVAFATRAVVARRGERRRREFAEQLEEALPLIAGALRAGFGLMQGLDAAARELPPPASDEFRRLVTETRLGRDLGDGLQAMAVRTGNTDFEWVVQAIEIHRQVGGDLAQVLDNVHATIRDRNRLRRQVQALSGEGRLSARILFVLPFAMALFIKITNPDYLGELTTTGFGIALLVGAVVMMLLGGFWMRRITRLVF